MEKKDYGIQMGTLVNMMTESDKVKTKQIQQTITKLKREAELLQKKEEKQQQKIEKIKQQLTEEEEENAREKSITEKWNEEFEKEHCKIKNSALFVRRYTDKEGKASTVFYTEQQLVVAYRHETYTRCVKGKEETVSYISKWLSCPKMRHYDTMDCIPPPLVCPSNVYNLWVQPHFESQPITKDDADFNTKAVSAFDDHIKILCGNDIPTYNYLCSWIAHAIQKPAQKVGVAITFESEEGVGKNIFITTLKELLGGETKCLETAEPERDVWGSFNEAMSDAYLVVLNETDKRNTSGHEGKIKAIITDNTLRINPKGKKGFVVNSYHRTFYMRNGRDGTKTHKGDRRNTIIRCSDEKKGNSKYFEDLTTTLSDKNALRSIYWRFRTMNIDTFKIGVPFITKYQNEIVSFNKDPLELFMIWFVENHTGIVKLTSVELFNKFTNWRHDNNFKFGEHINTLSLIKKLKLEIQIPDECMLSSHTMYGNVRAFDTNKIAQFLKLDYLVKDSAEHTDTEEEGEYVEMEEI
jgi:hypothetical protein